MNKATMTGITISIILGITLFLGMYAWFFWNANEAGVSVDAKYSNIYTNLNSTESDLEDTLNDIKDDLSKLEEPSSYLSVAFNGLMGLLHLLTLPLQIFNAAVNSLFVLATGIEIPTWAFVGLYLSIFAVIIWAIVGLIKGESKT